MAKLKDLTGETFGSLSVVSRATNTNCGQARWLCSCTCGDTRVVRGNELRTGKVTDCGHVGRAKLMERNYKHGHAPRGKFSPTYETWRGMIERCTNPRNKFYHNYGGSGIIVCERWLDFQNFLEDMGERPEGLTIERNDTLGIYEPSNCTWVTRSEQAKNRKWQWNDPRATKT